MVSSARQPCSICMRLAHLTFVKQHCMFLVHKGQAVHPFAEQNRSSTPSLQKRSAPKDPSLAQPSQSFIAGARLPTTMRASCSPALGCTRGVTRLRSRPVSYIVVGPGLSHPAPNALDLVLPIDQGSKMATATYLLRDPGFTERDVHVFGHTKTV